MSDAQTSKYEQLIVEVEFDPVGAAGTYMPICGMIDVTVNDTSNVDTSEVPDCDDESKPLSIEREVRSQEYSISGTGVMARQSYPKMRSWKVSGKTLNVRVRDKDIEDNGAVGDIYGDSGPALLTTFNRGRTKGQKVSAEMEIQFDGYPAQLVKA